MHSWKNVPEHEFEILQAKRLKLILHRMKLK